VVFTTGEVLGNNEIKVLQDDDSMPNQFSWGVLVLLLVGNIAFTMMAACCCTSASDVELKRHIALEHGDELKLTRAQRREAMTIPLQFQYRDDQGERGWVSRVWKSGGLRQPACISSMEGTQPISQYIADTSAGSSCQIGCSR
jgi:hypothetical protein